MSRITKIVQYTAVIALVCALFGCSPGKTPVDDVVSRGGGSASLDSITVTPQASSLAQGVVLKLVVTGQFSDKTSRTLLSGLTWTSSSTDVATVDNAGQVKGVKVGQATITVTSGTLVATATINVVPLALQAIAVTPTDESIFVKGQRQFTATGTFNDGTSRDLTAVETTWSSSGVGIATIDSNGMATGVAPGMVTISVTAPTLGSVTGTVITGTTTLLVQGVTLMAMSITPKLDSLVVGTKKPFKVTGTYTDGHTEVLTSNVTWSTSDPAVATVDITGEVTAMASGIAYISAAIANLQFPPPAKATVNVSNAQPTALLVTPLSQTLAIGENKSFTATLTFNNNTSHDVTSQASWTSSDIAVAFVGNETGNKGKVNALKSGTTEVKAIFSGQTGTTSVTVLNGTLQSIAVTPLNGSIPRGTTQPFTAEGIYDNGITRDITSSVVWSSSHLSVSIGTTTGLARGDSLGTSTITATLGSISGTTSLTVTSATISSLYVMPLFPSIYIGDEQEFTAIGVFSDGTTFDITNDIDCWTSSHINVATIDCSGDATGASAGISTIRAEFSGISGTTTLTVKSATLVSMELVPPDPIIPPGGVKPFLAIGTYSDGSIENLTNSASWLSFDPNIAVVDDILNKGLALGLTTGTTTIKAAQGTTTATTNITVTSATLTGISVTPANDSIPVGIRRQFTATAQFSDGSALDITSSAIWSATSTSIATVDNKGLAKGVSSGNAFIHATYLGQTGTSTLTVNNAAITSISVTPAGSTLGVGFTRQYMATANYSGSSYDVTADAVFTSGSGSILGVMPTGLATGVKSGQTNVNASFGGQQGSTLVTVKNLSLTAITVTPANSTVPLGGTLQYTAMGVYSDGVSTFTDSLPGVVSWSSLIPAVATIGGNTGIATGIQQNTTTIEAVFGVIVGTTTLTVVGPAPREVTAGGEHTCAVRTDNSLMCWGKNFSGQVGQGDNNNAILANPVSLLSKTVVGIAAGGAHTCAFLQNGSASCWGSNQKGQLGDGTYNATNLPKGVPNLLVKAMAAGSSHTCAILNTNTVRCWGDNGSGQLGDGSTVAASPTPVAVSLASSPSAITAGGAHTCVLYNTDGSVKCWGKNGFGQLGIGSTLDSNIPVSVISGGATAITAGGDHTCALLSGGTVKCWGDNRFGQLGDGTTGTSTQPISIPTLSNVTAVLAGKSHTCALVNTKVKCWGANSTGQLGDGTTANRNQPVDVSSPLSTEVVVDLGIGGSHSCALIQGGETRCWGSNKFGQLGLNTNPISAVPVTLPGIANANDLYGGRSHTCIVLSGTLKCMGNNQSGQLGDGTKTSTELAVDVSGISTATSMALGNRHTCVVLSTGAVQCWGENTSGQLGNGNNIATTTPVSTGITTASAISAGDSHSCAHLLNPLNTIQCWGNNSSGQLGNTNQNNSNFPITVANLTATAVSTGHDHTCALLTSGAVQCWGKNTDGQLGNGNATTTPSLVPGEVTGLSGVTVTAIAAGGSHTCALISGGTMKCWGSNSAGQLGDGSSTRSPSPVSVFGMTTAVAIAAGEEYTCALLSSTKTIQCWGSNALGQLGTGNTTNVHQPGTTVSTISTATSIHTGASHACAHLEDNTARCWGSADFGQLGSSDSIEIHTTTDKKVIGLNQ